MAYKVRIGTMLCPVAPSKLKLKIKNQNATMNLMNDGEINILKQPGLTEIEFDILLPNVKYPFAVYNGGTFKDAKSFLDILEAYKVNKEVFWFKVTRTYPNSFFISQTKMRTSLEDYTVTEDAKNGLDIVVSVKLKQYKDYGTKIAKIIEDDSEVAVSVEETRPTDETPTPTESIQHIVQKGDCLWNLAKLYYGDGSKYPAIYEANKDKINESYIIYEGQSITIPGASEVKSSEAVLTREEAQAKLESLFDTRENNVTEQSNVVTSENTVSHKVSIEGKQWTVMYNKFKEYEKVIANYCINGESRTYKLEPPTTFYADHGTKVNIVILSSKGKKYSVSNMVGDWEKYSDMYSCIVNGNCSFEVKWSESE